MGDVKAERGALVRVAKACRQGTEAHRSAIRAIQAFDREHAAELAVLRAALPAPARPWTQANEDEEER